MMSLQVHSKSLSTEQSQSLSILSKQLPRLLLSSVFLVKSGAQFSIHWPFTHFLTPEAAHGPHPQATGTSAASWLVSGQAAHANRASEHAANLYLYQ